MNHVSLWMFVPMLVLSRHSRFIHAGSSSRLGTVGPKDFRIMLCCKDFQRSCSEFTMQFFSPLAAASENRSESEREFEAIFEATGSHFSGFSAHSRTFFKSPSNKHPAGHRNFRSLTHKINTDLKYQHKHIIPPLDSCSFQRNPERHSKVSLQKTKVSDLVILHCTRLILHGQF